jgi:hypothetical protein
MFSDTTNAQQQTFLVQLMSVGIEVDRGFVGSLRQFFQRFDGLKSPKEPQS